MKDLCMTELDILGFKRAARERLLENRDRRRRSPLIMSLESLDDLLKRDEQREKDGFPKKIRIRKILVGAGKVIMVPYVEEEKLIHGEFEPNLDDDEGDEGEDQGNVVGSGEGEVGDVIGHMPVSGEGEGEDPQGGEGEGEHGTEVEAYKIGKELSEEFQLPNLRDKGKKVPTDEYVYDLTDRHRGSGQLLDKKATLRSIIKTNAALGRHDAQNTDTTKLVVGPQDKVYRVLSREKLWKPQAIVFFLRDYSGSMWGEPTRAAVTQHLMIYAWLLVQYEYLVIPRFIVHDTYAKEVSATRYFTRYFRENAGGGTLIASGYKKINEIVEGEGLASDYNIYVFQATDGEDFDNKGQQAIPELEKILGYANRMGVCVLKHPYYGDRPSVFENYIENSNILDLEDLFRIHVMPNQGVTDDDNIEAVKTLIAQS